jgi:hypothetical protein
MAPVVASDGSTLVALQPGSDTTAATISLSTDGGATWSTTAAG